MGELVPNCSQVPQQSATCTLEYLSSGLWHGPGIENDSGIGINFDDPNDQQGLEGIDLAYGSSRSRASNAKCRAPPLPVASSQPCPPDAHGYCSTVYQSGYDGNSCPINGPRPRYLYGRVTDYYIFQNSAPLLLRETAEKHQDFINEGDGICTPTTTWSPGEPKLQ